MKSSTESATAAEIYLDADSLRTGDVLVLRGAGKESAAIAFASGGRFSHAAFVMNSHLVLESDDAGVGYTAFVHLFGRIDKRRVHWVRLPYPVAEMVVLRHPQSTERTPDKILEAVEDRIKALYADPYSRMRRLVDASAIPGFLRPLSRTFLSISYDDTSREIEGIFCSELVAILFEELGLPLFSPRRSSSTISPNALLHSLLEPRGEVLASSADRAQLRDEDVVRSIGAPLLDRRLLFRVSKDKQVAHYVERMTAELNESIQSQNSELKRLWLIETQRAYATVVRELDGALQIGDLSYADRLIKLVESRVGLLALALQWLEDSTVPHGWTAHRKWSELGAEHARIMFARSLRLSREAERSLGRWSIRRWRLACRRRALLRQYVQMSQERQVLEPILEDIGSRISPSG